MTTILALAVKICFNSYKGLGSILDKDSIKSLTRIGRSLWGDLDRSFAISEDALTTVSLLQLSGERTVERASKVMIERAERNPPRLLALQHPFFRLTAMERFILTALHIEKWSYGRVGRVLNVETSLIETLAWASRLKLCFQELNAEIEYPRAPSTLGPSCPEYNLSSPWTQRMLDDELGKRERLFLQNHLMACEKCRMSLNMTRKMFYKIEGVIPVRDAAFEMEAATNRIYDNWKAGESAFRPIKTTVSESIVKFLNDPKIQLSLAGLSLFFFYWSRHSPS
jgi:hypothetical protein